MRIHENRGTGKREDQLQVEHRLPAALRVSVTSPRVIQVSTVLRYSFDGTSWHLPFFFNLRISLEDSLGYGFTKASILRPRASQGGGRWETRTGRPLLGSVWSLLTNLAPYLSSGIMRNALSGFTPPDGSPTLYLRRFLQVLHASILVKNTEKWPTLATFSSLQKLDVDAKCTMLTGGLIQRDINL